MQITKEIIIAILALAISLGFYFLPTIIARKKQFVLQLFLLNLLLGWTFFGWIVALVWAFKKPKQISVVQANINANTFAELEKLGELTKQGILTSEEFDQQKAKILGNQPNVIALESTTPESTKKKLQIISVIIMVFVMLVGLVCFLYIVPKYIYGQEATARQFFNGLSNNEDFPPRILSAEYMWEARQNSLPKIYRYKIIAVKEISTNQFAVLANVTGRNGFGAELTREVGLIIEKEYDSYHITDSYNLIITRSNKIVFPDDVSDMQKVTAVKNLILNLEINSVKYDVNYFGNARGNDVIKNNGKYAVQFIEVAVAYKNQNQQAVNSDKVYAVGADELQPGESRTFTWFTSGCYQCYNVNIYPIIKDNN